MKSAYIKLYVWNDRVIVEEQTFVDSVLFERPRWAQSNIMFPALCHANYTGYIIVKIGIIWSLGQPLLLIKQRHTHHIVSKQAKVFLRNPLNLKGIILNKNKQYQPNRLIYDHYPGTLKGTSFDWQQK